MTTFSGWIKILHCLGLFLIAVLWSSYVLSKPIAKLETQTDHFEFCVRLSPDFNLLKTEALPLNTIHTIANHYLYGTCGERDTSLAIKLMESAANKGHVESAYILGELFYVGETVPSNFDKSKKYYLMAAEKGSLKAQHEFGVVLLKEATTENERLEALYWLGMAANQNDGFSAYILGMVHQTGLHGVPKNPCLALDWYEGAKTMGFPDRSGLHASLQRDFDSLCN